MFTDGSRLYDGASGYVVVWKRGQTWVGIKTHMGYNQEACDAECAAHAGAASRRPSTPERVTDFTDAQAAIRRMASEVPGPGQQYALQARMHIATLRRARPGIATETRWCPAHNGAAGNERADKWAKIAGEEPDTRGVEWLCYSDRPRHAHCLSQDLLHTSSGGFRKEVGGGTAVDSRPEFQEEIQDADGPGAGQHGGLEHQEACLAVLPGENKVLPYRAVSPLDEEPSNPAVLVVPLPEADEGPSLQGVS